MTMTLLTSVSSALAQGVPQYKVIPVSAKFRDVPTAGLEGDEKRVAIKRNSEARKARNTARDAAKGGIASGNMVPVKEFMNGYLFPQMTQPEQLKESGALRDRFFRGFMKPDVNESSRKKLIGEVILPAMQAIAKGPDYSPAARLNAVAFLGRLDDSPLVRTGTRVRPPRPSAAGLEFLNGMLTDEKIPAWLKAASIQGILRHLQVDQAVGGRLLGDEKRDQLETFATNALDGKAAGQDDWDADLDYWLKRRSVQLLGALGRSGAGGSIVDRLVTIIADEQQTVWMQLDGVKALRDINFAGVAEAKVTKVMVTVTDFLRRQLASEDLSIGDMVEDLVYKNILYGNTDFAVSGTKYAKNVGKAAPGAMSMMMEGPDMEEMMAGEMMGSGKKMEPPAVMIELPTYQLNLIRRRMKIFAFSANDVLQNAPGIESAASDKDKELRVAINEFTENFLQESSVGVVDVNKLEEAMAEKSQSFTEQLRILCRDGSLSLRRMLTRHSGGGIGDLDQVLPGGSKKKMPANPFGIGG